MKKSQERLRSSRSSFDWLAELKFKPSSFQKNTFADAAGCEAAVLVGLVSGSSTFPRQPGIDLLEFSEEMQR